MKKHRPMLAILPALTLLAGLAAHPLAATAGPAASGKIDCSPEGMAKLTGASKKKAERICPKIAAVHAKDAEKAKAREDWFQKNVKGKPGMEKVFQANNGRIPSNVEDLGDRVLWRYVSKSSGAILSQCKEYVFGPDGQKLVSNRTYACDV